MMIRNTFFAAGLIAFAFGSSHAIAGDRWQECTTINNSLFSMEGEDLYEVDGDQRKQLDYKKLETVTISDEAGYCETKDGSRFNWANLVYVLKMDVAGTAGPFKLWALCEEGGSGFPASNEIDTTCVKNVHTTNKVLVPAYEDKAGE